MSKNSQKRSQQDKGEHGNYGKMMDHLIFLMHVSNAKNGEAEVGGVVQVVESLPSKHEGDSRTAKRMER
jgi:hypothetical protein